MAERTKSERTGPASRPVPMKLFATWEVDRTPPNCIPRLCSLTLTRLVILRPLGSDLASISIAVKMQSSKRTLRSNEMSIPTGGMLDTELELQFALQYPHFLKRDGNKLLILLQRRKRYKNRTILGYKTLAEGIINMAQVLQKKQMDLELELVSDKAEKYGGHSVALARVSVMALSSQPVDHDKRVMNDPNERLCPEFSDEEEEFSSEAEPEGSDSEPTVGVHRRKNRGKIPVNARQRNLKQKFIALLKRFRVSEELDHDQEEIGQKLSGGDMEIEELFDELEDLSDSGPELDTMSVSSTPKPSLRPFFSSSRTLLAPSQVVTSEESGVVPFPSTTLQQPPSFSGKEKQWSIGYVTPERGLDRQSDENSRRADSDSHPENWTDHEANDPPSIATGSPPKSEQAHKADRDGIDRKSRLFARDRGIVGGVGSGGSSAGAGGGVGIIIGGGGTSGNIGGTGSGVVGAGSGGGGGAGSGGTNTAGGGVGGNVSGSGGSAGGGIGNNSGIMSAGVGAGTGTIGGGIPGSNKSKKHSLSVDLKSTGDVNSSEPRKALIEQLTRVLPDDSLPETVSLVSLADPGGAVLAVRLQERNHRVLTTASPADIRATFTCLVARIQKFCNSSAKPPTPIKVVIAGGDSFVNSVLRHYVDLLSFRPPDWQNYLRFLVVPLGSNTLSKYLCSVDGKYSVLFGEEWRESLERESSGGVCAGDGAARVSEYLAGANSTLALPIAEAMVTYRETDDSSQIFIPFVNDVRVGCPDSSASASVDLDESSNVTATSSGSPPSLPTPGLPIPSGAGKLTPPSSPNVGQPSKQQSSDGWEPVELQLDYWSKQTQGDKGKNTVRQAFRALHVQRLPASGETPGQHLSMNFTTKEKKQKIMRLGKKKEKEKENEPKSQTVDGVTRLICSAKTHNIPLRVSIDGTEWYGVKFFQLSAQWQTHIKTFPIALLDYNPQHQMPNLT